jgi:hypothetical protein
MLHIDKPLSDEMTYFIIINIRFNSYMISIFDCNKKVILLS